jgi:hypothetical protein
MKHPLRRHKQDTATFEELDFHGQARAMNATILQFRKQFRAHLRCAADEGRNVKAVQIVGVGLLERAALDLRSTKVISTL